jgi:hypothetical protein
MPGPLLKKGKYAFRDEACPRGIQMLVTQKFFFDRTDCVTDLACVAEGSNKQITIFAFAG